MGRGRASGRFIAIYAVAYATLWLALLTPAIITLALRVEKLVPGNSARPISLVLMVGAIVAMVSNPLFGAASDATRTRFGRRKPWLWGGMLGGCASLAFIAFASTVNEVLVGWSIAQLCFNAALAAIVAIIPDQIPATQRGTVVGILGICMPIGQITGTFLVQQLAVNLTLALIVPGVIGVAGMLLLTLYLPSEAGAYAAREGTAGALEPIAAVSGSAESASPAALTGPAVSAGPAAASAGLAASPASPPANGNHRDFTWAWLSRVLYTTGSCFLQAYQPLFLLESLGVAAAAVPGLIFRSTLVQAVMVVIWSLIAGRLSDRTRRRKPFVMAGSAIQACGLLLIAASHTYESLLLGVAMVGMGHGVYEGVDLALVTEVLPDRDRHAAKDLGLLNVANTLPQVIAPLGGPAILTISRGDYGLLFVIAGVVALLGSVFLIPLRKVR